MRKYLVIVLVCLSLTLSGCGGGGGGGGAPPDPCAGGPVPCFTGDWGPWAYVFSSDATWNSYYVRSDGDIAAVVWAGPGWPNGPQEKLIGGWTTSCYNLPINDYVELWWDPYKGYWLEYYLGEATGSVEICLEVLTITDLWIRGGEWGSDVAQYSRRVELTAETVKPLMGDPDLILRIFEKMREHK